MRPSSDLLSKLWSSMRIAMQHCLSLSLAPRLSYERPDGIMALHPHHFWHVHPKRTMPHEKL